MLYTINRRLINFPPINQLESWKLDSSDYHEWVKTNKDSFVLLANKEGIDKALIDMTYEYLHKVPWESPREIYGYRNPIDSIHNALSDVLRALKLYARPYEGTDGELKEFLIILSNDLPKLIEILDS